MSCCQGIRDEKSQTHPDKRRRRPTHTQKNGNVRFFFRFARPHLSINRKAAASSPPPPFYSHSKKHNRENSLGVRKKVAPLLLLAFWLHELLNPCFSSSSFLNAVICRWGREESAAVREMRRAAWIGWFFFFSSKVIFGFSGG